MAFHRLIGCNGVCSAVLSMARSECLTLQLKQIHSSCIVTSVKGTIFTAVSSQDVGKCFDRAVREGVRQEYREGGTQVIIQKAQS